MASHTGELKSAIKVANEFWSSYSHTDKNNSFFHLFKAILELIEESPMLEAGMVEECFITTSELAERVGFIAGAKPGIFHTGRLNKEYRKLNCRLEELKPSFERIVNDLGVGVIPIIHKQANAGGQGKQSSYRILVQKIDVQPKMTSLHDNNINSSNPNDIDYYLESVPKLPIYTRWLQHIDMSKHRWKMLIFTGSPFLCFFASTYSIIAAYYQLISPHTTGIIAGVSILYIALFMMWFRYLIHALNYNITTLPDVMLPMSLKSAVIHYELNEPGHTNGRLKCLTIKVYAAKCPICSHRVYIKSVGSPFKPRPIGICDNNPLEHRYSFDFTTKKGAKLT